MIREQPKYFVSRPTLYTLSGNSVCVQVGQSDDPNSKKDSSVGFSLAMKPTVVDEDQIQLDYEMTKTARMEAADGDETVSKDQSANNLRPMISKSTVQIPVRLSLVQTFVVGSRQKHAGLP